VENSGGSSYADEMAARFGGNDCNCQQRSRALVLSCHLGPPLAPSRAYLDLPSQCSCPHSREQSTKP
jgi:hypothetical protein